MDVAGDAQESTAGQQQADPSIEQRQASLDRQTPQRSNGEDRNDKRRRKRPRKNDATASNGPPPEFDFAGNDKQQRLYDSDDASYRAHGWEYKRRRLLTLERNASLLPASGQNSLTSQAMQRVDFGQLAASDTTKFGTRLLFENMSDEDVDTLVGLATTLDAEQEDGWTALGGEDLFSEYIDVDTTNETAATTPNGFRDARKHNPMLTASMDSPPPPPSFVKYIQSRAEQQVFKDPTVNGKNKRGDEKNGTQQATKHLESAFDASAAVAVGMAVEEAVTASLLPLAGLHVLRCRAIEDMVVTEDDNKPSEVHSQKRVAIHPVTGEKIELDMELIDWKNEKAFQEWTLPPEEAITKLLDQGLISPSVNHFLAAPSLQYSSSERAANYVPQEAYATNQPSTMSTKKYFRLWGKRHNLHPNILASNRRAFAPFLHPVNPKDFQASLR